MEGKESARTRAARRSAMGLLSTLPLLPGVYLDTSGALTGVKVGLLRLVGDLKERSSWAGVLSRLRTIPSRCSSSSRAGLPSRSRSPRLVPPRLLDGPSSLRPDFCGVFLLDLVRHVSKQSAQQGFPSRSTMGASPMSLPHPSHWKHFLCHTLPPFSTKPPSVLSISTGRKHAGQSPLEPPLSTKHGRQRNRVLSPAVSARPVEESVDGSG